MDEFLTTYEVEFPAPRTPEDWTVTHFEMALAHLLAEESLHMTVDGDELGVRLGWTEGLSRQIHANPRHATYTLLQAVRFTPTGSLPDKTARLQAWLVDALGLHPRQFEGPWNIIGLTVSPVEGANRRRR
jgi:hypothetical protein